MSDLSPRVCCMHGSMGPGFYCTSHIHPTAHVLLFSLPQKHTASAPEQRHPHFFSSCFYYRMAYKLPIRMMLENNFTGQVPACRGESCPGPCGLYAPVSCQDCQQPPLGCCDAGKTCVYNCTINDSCPPPPPPPPTGNYKCNGLLKICLPFGGTQSHSDCKAAC